MGAKLEVMSQYWDKVISEMIRGLSKEKNKEKRKANKEMIDMSMQLRP